MTTIRNSMWRIGTACAFLLAGAGVQAAPISTSFDLTDPDSRADVYNSTYAKTYNYSNDGIDLTLTGWSYNSSSKIIQDWVGKWDGLGVEKVNSPNHAVDNEGRDYDMLLLSFSTQVKLDQVTIGWWSNDSDVSLLAFNGAGAPGSFTGKTWQELLGAGGWVSAGDYYDVKQNPGVNPGSIASQYWLIGAHNPNLGGSWTGGNANVRTGTDYFKVKGVAVSTVPEPGSLALIGAALLGIGLSRRRALQAA